MSKVEDFLTNEEEQEIVAAICMAEQNTSGEIRVHIEKTTSLDAYDRALEVFQQLKMDQTELKNGVLIYVAVKDRNFVICGDEGINNVVKDDFWNSTRDAIVSHFKNGDFKQGLIAGIIKAGEQLQQYFPHLDGDVNELSNEISKG